ncbi:hypothetical protein [Rhizomonospora bruguierae]|uniref:hypothetical protein n=1 Tax=Rhizomonospora bruguierae TaxID=1581705 RepID=UPI001BCD1460|nr:hypothetical protein [Micromonospora sp. NBRC 107566]
MWAAPRRTRLTVYLAGTAVNLVIAAGCLLARAAIPAGHAHDLLAAATLLALLALLLIPTELLVFMRTDAYYVVQDLAGCTNLYADGSAYARYRAKLLWHGLSRGRVDRPTPAAHCPGTNAGRYGRTPLCSSAAPSPA